MELIALLWKIRFQNKNILKITANRLLKFKFEASAILPYKVHFTSVKKLKFRFSRLLGERDVIPSPSHHFRPKRYRALPGTLLTAVPHELPQSQFQLPVTATHHSTLSTMEHSSHCPPSFFGQIAGTLPAYSLKPN